MSNLFVFVEIHIFVICYIYRLLEKVLHYLNITKFLLRNIYLYFLAKENYFMQSLSLRYYQMTHML